MTDDNVTDFAAPSGLDKSEAMALAILLGCLLGMVFRSLPLHWWSIFALVFVGLIGGFLIGKLLAVVDP